MAEILGEEADRTIEHENYVIEVSSRLISFSYPTLWLAPGRKEVHHFPVVSFFSYMFVSAGHKRLVELRRCRDR